MRLLAPFLAVLSFALVLPAQTSTVTLTADRDNTLFEDPNGALSNGAGIYLFGGTSGQPTIRRVVLRFPLSAIPTGSRIVSASLQLNVSRSIAFNVRDMSAHRLLADWGEGTSNAPAEEGTGAPSTTNDATWLHRNYPSVSWTSPGGDFAVLPSSTSPTPSSGTAIWPSTPLLVADVQHFLDQPAGNFGWLLKMDNEIPVGEVRRFDSRQHSTASRRPKLTVTYLPPGAVMSVGTGCVGGSGTLSLTAPQPPGPGFTLAIGSGQPGTLAGNVLSVGLAPAPVPIYAGCSLYLDQALGLVTYDVLFLSGSGTGSTQWPFPTGYRGTEVAFQSFALDLGVPAGFVLSNALRAVAP